MNTIPPNERTRTDIKPFNKVIWKDSDKPPINAANLQRFDNALSELLGDSTEGENSTGYIQELYTNTQELYTETSTNKDDLARLKAILEGELILDCTVWSS